MQKSSCLHMLKFLDYISISSPRCSSHNVLIKRERYEHNNDKKINNGADSTHGFRDLLLVYFGHVLSLQPGFHECWSKPPYHRV